MEKYLFLDFDGVLNTAWYAKPMPNRLAWKQALMVVEKEYSSTYLKSRSDQLPKGFEKWLKVFSIPFSP